MIEAGVIFAGVALGAVNETLGSIFLIAVYNFCSPSTILVSSAVRSFLDFSIMLAKFFSIESILPFISSKFG